MENAQSKRNGNLAPVSGAPQAPNQQGQRLPAPFSSVNTLPPSHEPGPLFAAFRNRTAVSGPSRGLVNPNPILPISPFTHVEFDEITQVLRGQERNKVLNNMAGKQSNLAQSRAISETFDNQQAIPQFGQGYGESNQLVNSRPPTAQIETRATDFFGGFNFDARVPVTATNSSDARIGLAWNNGANIFHGLNFPDYDPLPTGIADKSSLEAAIHRQVPTMREPHLSFHKGNKNQASKAASQHPSHVTESGNDMDVEMVDVPAVGLLEDEADINWYSRYGCVPYKTVKFPGRMLGVNPEIEYYFDFDKYFKKARLSAMSDNIMVKIFEQLDTPSQICLALAHKSLARASRLLHNGRGITYSHGDKLRLFGRLGPWMTTKYGLCVKCNKFLPRDPNVWNESRRNGRHKTNSEAYGRHPDQDFLWEDGECPECRANRKGERLHGTRVALMDCIWGPNWDIDNLMENEYRGGNERIDAAPLPHQGHHDQSRAPRGPE